MCRYDVLEGEVEVITRYLHHSDIRHFFVLNLDRDFEFFKSRLLLRVFHVSDHDAFLHLSDVLLLHHSDEMFEFLHIVVRVVAISFSHATVYYSLFPFFLESTDLLSWD